MKKKLIFSVSFVFSVILFILVAISVTVKPDFSKETSSTPAKSKGNTEAAEALVIYDDGVYAPLIFNMRVSNGVFSAESILTAEVLSDYREGIFTLLQRQNMKYYINFSEKTFEKVADILKIVVYNEEKQRDVLLTGRQAANRMSVPFFCETVMNTLNSSDRKTLDELFSCLTNEADCYLNYTEYHDIFGG